MRKDTKVEGRARKSASASAEVRRPRTARRPAISRLELARELRERGMRATGPRLSILEYLRSAFSHPTAEAVHATLQRRQASLSLSTVYETLESFLETGLCRRVAARSGRLRVDGTIDDHDHAVCRSCGEVLDVQRPPSLRLAQPRELPPGTELIGLHIEYEVICARCQRGAAR